VLLIDRSTRIGSGAGALICPAGSSLRLDCAEDQGGGIDRFPIVAPYHADSSGFIV
jgi:hypothetical protein